MTYVLLINHEVEKIRERYETTRQPTSLFLAWTRFCSGLACELLGDGPVPGVALRPMQLYNNDRRQGMRTLQRATQQGVDLEVAGGVENPERHIQIDVDELQAPFIDIRSFSSSTVGRGQLRQRQHG